MLWAVYCGLLSLAVAVSSADATSVQGVRCPPGMVYCLATGMCVSKDPVDYGECEYVDPVTSSSGYQSGGEMNRCPYGEVYCLTAGMCVTKDADGQCEWSSTGSSSSASWRMSGEICPPGEVYCLTTGMCVSKDASDFGQCDFRSGQSGGWSSSGSDPGHWSKFGEKCPPGEVYCLTAGMCVAKDASDFGQCDFSSGQSGGWSSSGSDPGHWGMFEEKCPPGEVYCLTAGMCVAKDASDFGQCDFSSSQSGGWSSSESDSGHWSMFGEKCPPGEVYCLTAGMCVSKDDSDFGQCDFSSSQSGCWSRGGSDPGHWGMFGEKCSPGEVYCLTTGMCVSKDPADLGQCNFSSDEYWSSTGSGSDRWHMSGEKCPPGQIYCLTTQLCVWREPEPNCDCRCDSWIDWCSWSSDIGPNTCQSSSSVSSVRTRSPLASTTPSGNLSSSGDASHSGSNGEDHKGMCPVLLVQSSDGPCVDTCMTDSECGQGEKCCSGQHGCSMCLPVDTFELPLLCPHPREEHSTWFQDFLGYGIRTSFVGDIGNLRIGLQSLDSDVPFTVYSAQIDGISGLSSWEEIDIEEGVRADARLWFKYREEGPPGGTYPVMVTLMNSNKQVLRQYGVNFLHFPHNPKPLITLRNEALLSVEEDSWYAAEPISSLVQISDPPSEDTFPTAYTETTRSHTLEDCQNKYNEYMSSVEPSTTPGVYVVPNPLPQQATDVTWQLKVTLAEDRRKRALDEDNHRFLSPLGGAVYTHETLTFIPDPEWSGTLNFDLWALDGTDSPDLGRLVEERWRPGTLPKREELLLNSPNVGNKVTIVVKVTSVNDPPELQENFLSNLRLGRTDLETDIPPRHVSHDMDENKGFPAALLVKKYFEDRDSENIGLALVMGESEAGKYQWKASADLDWQDLDLTTSKTVHSALLPDNVAQAWEMIEVSEGSSVESLESYCLDNEHITAVHLLSIGAWVRFVPTENDMGVQSHFAFTAYDPDSIDNIDTVTWPHQMSVCVPVCLSPSLCGSGTALARYIVPGLIQREGCDGEPGSGFELDECNVCGGDSQSCSNDCHGTLNGRANKVCGICVGGDTGLPLDEGKDCRGVCDGPHVYKQVKLYNMSDPAGTHYTRKMCLREDVDPHEFVLDRFCDGYVGSPATLDSCGVCSGGHSGHVMDSALDVCEVCDGDGTSCEDCAGVANGDSSLDTCGLCLADDDPQRDSSCVELGRFSQKMVRIRGEEGQEVFVGGANLYNLNIIDSCELLLYMGDTEASPRKSITLDADSVEWATTDDSQRVLTFVTPVYYHENPIDTGSYKLLCTFSGNGYPETKLSTGSIILYDTLDFMTITPDTFNIGQIDSAQVTGNGMMSKSLVVYLKCPTDWTVYSIPECFSNTVKLPGSDQYFVQLPVALDLAPGELSDLDFSLSLSPLMTDKMTVGMSLEIVAFFNEPRLPEELEQATPLTIHIQGRVPMVTDLGFTKTLCGLWIRFDMNIQTGSGDVVCQKGQRADVLQQCCGLMFTKDTVTKFGTGAKCFTDASDVGVLLAEDHSVASGVMLQFTERSIQQRGVQGSVTVYADHTQTYTLPQIKRLPTVEVFAPTTVGVCSVIHLNIKAGGALGCWPSRIRYQVSVDFTDTERITLPDDVIAATKLQTLNDQLKATTDASSLNILPDQLVEGWSYDFTVTITNMVEGQSGPVVVTVMKEAEDKPVDFMLFGEKTIKPTDIMQIQAVVRATACFKSRIAHYTYTYTVENSGEINLNKYENLRKFRINYKDENGNYIFRGGSVYRIKGEVHIELHSGVTLTVEDRLSIFVAEIPIQIYIEPLADRWSRAEPIILDASKSVDNNNPYSQDLLYIWDCEMLDSSTSDNTCYGNWDGDANVAISSIELGYEAVAEIPAYSLNMGKYTFILTVYSDSRNASASISLEIIDEDPPKAYITAPGVLNPQETMRINAKVCCSTEAYMEWRPVGSDGLNQLDLESSCESKLKRNKPAEIDCVYFPLICKELEMDSVYQFKLYAENLRTKSYQEVTTTFQTANAPTITQLTISPSSGVAIETVFTVSVSALSTDPLLYSYFYTGNNDKTKLFSKEAVNDLELLLPAGDGFVCVTVCSSTTGICSDRVCEEVTVSSNKISELVVADLEDLIGGIESPLSFLRVLLESGVDLENGVDGEGNPLSVEFVANVTDMIMSLAIQELLSVPEDDYEMAFSLIQSVVQIIPGVELLQDLITVLFDLIRTFSVQSSTNEANGVRKRRAIEEKAAPVVTEDQVEAVLQIYHVLLRNTADTDLEPTQAQSYLDTVDSYMVAMCNGMIFEQSVVTAASEIGCIGTEWRGFENVHNQSFSIGNCSSVNINTASIFLGQEVSDLFSLWDCKEGEQCEGEQCEGEQCEGEQCEGEQCEGACVATHQSPRDTYTVTSPVVVPLLSTRRSDVVDAQLVNPSTGVAVNIGVLNTPVTFVLQLQGEVSLTEHSLVCRQFVSGDWTEDTCEVTSEVTKVSTQVMCECSRLQPTAVFEADPMITSTKNATLDSAETSTASTGPVADTEDRGPTTTDIQIAPVVVPPSAVSVRVVFSFSADYSDLIGTGADKAAFISSSGSQLAVAMQIDMDRIKEIVINGQDVSFLVVRGETGESALHTAVTELKRQVLLGTLDLVALDGTPLYTLMDSFMASPLTPTTAKLEDTTQPAKTSTNLSLIIGCVVGGVLLLVIIVLIVVIVCIKTKSSRPRSVSPQPLFNEKGLSQGYVSSSIGTSASPPPTYEDLIYERHKYSRSSLSASIGQSSGYDGMPAV